jgi:ATP-dependent DNA helicase DinG
LSLVVIDRLPFPNMGDPIYTADVERLGWFKASVPPTKTLFRQGVGRLLRSAEDVGIIAVMDERLKSKGYGKVLTGSIQTQYIPTKAQAIDFLKQLRSEIEGPTIVF